MLKPTAAGEQMPDFVAGKYLIIDGIPARAGGLSVVRKAVDTNTGTFVAVKFVQGATDRISKKVFEREAEALASLDHANIVRLLDSGVDDTGTYYLVLEWCEDSLEDLLAKTGGLGWRQALEKIGLPIAEGMSHAHLKGVENRDIKPSNILLREDGSPVLADFGIGKGISEQSTGTMTVQAFRSGLYAPPEVAAPYRYVRDVYSFGVVLIQTMTEERLRNFHELEPSLASLVMPPALREILGRCISADPASRARNGAVLLQELTEFLQHARAAEVARENYAWLRLTSTARRQLAPEQPPVAAAEVVLMRDLSESPYISYRFDPEKSTYDLQTIFLIGHTRRYVLKPDLVSGELTVTSAIELSFEELESYRRRSLSVAGWISWTTTQPLVKAAIVRGLATIQSALDGFYSSANQSVEAGGGGDDLLDGWHRTLQAREELARGDMKILSYERQSVDRREVSVIVTNPPELDLTGTEWEVRPSRDSRHYLSRVEVVSHDSTALNLIHQGKTVAIPAKGVLVPYLGPSQVALQRQIDAVANVKAGTTVRPDLKNLLAEPSTARLPTSVPEPVWAGQLDDSKRQAIRGALGAEDLVLVTGPPGTGKTKLIAELALQTLRARPDARILIVSQTHVAVDNALERLDALGIAGLVRLGAPDDVRISESVGHLRLDQQMHKWATQVKRRAESHLESMAQSSGVSANHLKAALCLQQLAAIVREREAVRAASNQVLEGEAESSLAMTLEVSLDPVDLQRREQGLDERFQRLLAEANALLAGDLTVASTLTEADASAAVDSILGGTSSARSLMRVVELQGEWLERIASDENLASSFLQTSRVISGTCLGFLRNNAVRDLSIDLCVVDEASKATSTEILVPISRSKRAILVGDDNQLAPLDEDLVRRTDILDEFDLDPEVIRETLFQRLADRLPDGCKYTLTDQYRMIQPIGDLISTCFYGGALRSPRTDGLRGYSILGAPVLWLNTQALGERRREQSDGGFSFSNRAEAQVILERLQTLDRAVENGIVPLKGGEPLEVLLIAPYRSQVEEIRRRLAVFRSQSISVRIESVDAVQGREADIVLFSVTRSNAFGRLGFLGLNHWRRINVALSRARFGLTIVGDAQFCSDVPGALRDVLTYIKQHPSDCEVRDLTNG